MIGDTILSCIAKKDHQKLKDYEHMKYRELHKSVLTDKGIPNLSKKGYGKEGYR